MATKGSWALKHGVWAIINRVMDTKEGYEGVWAIGKLVGFRGSAKGKALDMNVCEKMGLYEVQLCYNVHKVKRYAIISVG